MPPPPTDLHGVHSETTPQAPTTFASFGRSILSLRRDHVPETSVGCGDIELDVFHRHVAELFVELNEAGDEILSLSWTRRLLDTFHICLEEFRAAVLSSSAIARPPLDKLVGDFFDRSVKALDVCNAVRDGVGQIRHWHRHLSIALTSLQSPTVIGEAQVRRASKALTDLTILMLDEKDAASAVATSRHNRSFGRRQKEHGPHHRSNSGGSSASSSHFRSLSWSVSRNWSAARQLQAIGSSIPTPRPNEVTATGGLANAVFAMSNVLFIVMWSLVAAIPCQDRGLGAHFSAPPRGFPWSASVTALYDKILDESKKKERKNASGLLREIFQIERCSRQLAEITDSVLFPITEEKMKELLEAVGDLAEVCDVLKEGLDPLEKQLRELFHRLVRSRTEGLDCLGKLGNAE